MVKIKYPASPQVAAKAFRKNTNKIYLNFIRHNLMCKPIKNMLQKIYIHTCREIDLPLNQPDCLHALRHIWNQTEFHLVPKQSENCKYNQILVDSTKIRSRFLLDVTKGLLNM